MNLLNNLILSGILLAFCIAVTAFVYSYVLTGPGEIFGKLFLKLDIFFGTDARAREGKGAHPLFKMIMWCEKCVAGQMSFWIFLIAAWPWYTRLYFILIIPHFLFVGLSIFLTLIVKQFYIKNQN